MRKPLRFTVWALSFTLPLMAYTNCSSPAVEEETDLAAQAEKSDFAYDSVFDQLAYMSCSELASKSFDSSSYFTFRAGAYRSGGIKIRENFRAAIEDEFRLQEDQIGLITSSPINTLTNLQFAIRSRANFQSVFTQSGSAEANEDYADLFMELGTYELVESLLNLGPGVRSRYMRNGFPSGARFEGSLNLSDSTLLQESLRSMLTSEGMLALTYTDREIGRTYARSPADLTGGDANQAVYGKGLVVSFRQPTPPSGGLYGQYPNYVLREVSEINLESRDDKTDLRSWSCPTTLQFRIVRPGDNPILPCNAAPDPEPLSADLQIVRRSLRVEDWYVDMANRCITPKKQSGRGCYGSIETVNYNLAVACVPGTNTQDCVHWTSICVRQ